MRKCAAVSVMVCLAAALAVPGGAAANHRHSLLTGSGSCVVLAKEGGEPYVVLPGASFNNTNELATTANPHPLHVHVHRGAAGQEIAIGVYGNATTDPCFDEKNYLNDPPPP